jgi:hypothetical protein
MTVDFAILAGELQFSERSRSFAKALASHGAEVQASGTMEKSAPLSAGRDFYR